MSRKQPDDTNQNGGSTSRISSGSAQIDAILSGGFPANSINIVMGQPGTGKTVLAEQLMFYNADVERPTLYFTTLSEPLAKVVRYAQEFRFFDDSKLSTAIHYHDLGEELARDGAGSLIPRLKESIRTISPGIIVIDSFKAVKDLIGSDFELRHLVYQLTGLLTAYDTTAFLLGEYEEADIARFPEFAAADGIVELSRRSLGARDDRYFRVFKLRGSQYLEGAHAFRITTSGLEVFPRLRSPDFPPEYAMAIEREETGIEVLDQMTNGGFWRGSSTMIAGPSGAGKTTIALQFALAGARRGLASLYLNFQENPTQLARSVRSLANGADPASVAGLELMYASPVELQIDSIVGEIFRRIRDHKIQRLVIDAVGDLAGSAGDRQRVHEYLYAMLQHLAVNKVTSMLTIETPSPVTGQFTELGPVSSLVDNVIVLSMTGDDVTRRTLRIMKTRGSAHDARVREFEITADGVRLV